MFRTYLSVEVLIFCTAKNCIIKSVNEATYQQLKKNSFAMSKKARIMRTNCIAVGTHKNIFVHPEITRAFNALHIRTVIISEPMVTVMAITAAELNSLKYKLLVILPAIAHVNINTHLRNQRMYITFSNPHPAYLNRENQT